MSDTPRTDAIAPVGYARAQDLLLYSEVWAGYSNKPADENGHPPVALYTQDQVDMLLAALREQLAERDAEIAALKGHAVEPRIGLNSDGSLDEVVGSPGHIEQLDSGHWFVEIGEYAIWLHAKGKIVAHYEHRAAYPKE